MAESTTCIGVMAGGSFEFETVQSLLGAIIEKAAAALVLSRSGPYLDDGRNRLVSKFYEPPFAHCDRLLIVDSDIGFTSEDIKMLEEDDLPVVSGVYLGSFAGLGVLPVVYEWYGNNGDSPNMRQITEWSDGKLNDNFSDNPLIEVDGVGAGFLMVKREVFDHLWEIYGKPLPWFAEHVRHDVHWGEDLTFCHRLTEVGIPIHVDRRVNVAHYKTMKLGMNA